MNNPRIKFFIIFHQKLISLLYKNLRRYKKDVIFVGAKRRISTLGQLLNKYNIIYQRCFKIQKPELEKCGYRETSTILHIYYNKLYAGCEYVGFAQYDMEIGDEIFEIMLKQIREHPGERLIFYTTKMFFDEKEGFFNDAINPHDFMLKSYNRYFGTDYSADFIRRNKITRENMIIYSTFVIPIDMFEKIAGWISSFVYELCGRIKDPDFSHLKKIVARVAERAYGLALAIELSHDAARLIKIPIAHRWSNWKSKIKPSIVKKLPFLRIIKKWIDELFWKFKNL